MDIQKKNIFFEKKALHFCKATEEVYVYDGFNFTQILFFVNRRKRIYTNLYYTILFYTGLPVWQPSDCQTDYQVTVKLYTIGIPSDYQKTKTLYRRKIDFLCMSV